jgi:hypothetical protein
MRVRPTAKRPVSGWKQGGGKGTGAFLPQQALSAAKVRMPDFAARLKKIHGEKVISAGGAQAILDENQGRY